MAFKFTKEEFVKRARQIHGDKYDYSKTEYVNNKTKVCIICPEHGEFWQAPSSHLSGRGCPKCGKSIMAKKRVNDCKNLFVEKACKVHNDRYNYSKVEYISAHTKVCIICPEHGEFWQTPNSHLNRNGCPICANNKPLTTEEFIEKAKKVHGNMYDYAKTEYVSGHIKVEIKCLEHGNFWQDPYAHLSGQGCPKCFGNIKSSTTEFIEKARKVHGDRYDYSKVEYVNNNTKVCIICPEHGEFWITPNNHLKNKGCAKCNSKGNSNIIKIIENKLKEYNIDYVREVTYPWLKRRGHMFLDIFLPDFGIAIECHGLQHFISQNIFGGDEAFKDNVDRDLLKYKLCKEHNISIYYFAKSKHEYFDKIFTNPDLLIKEICKQKQLVKPL